MEEMKDKPGNSIHDRSHFFLQDQIETVGVSPGKVAALFSQRIDDLHERQRKTERDVDHIKTAFAGGDYEGHRRYHETVIEILAERRRLRIAIQEKTLSGLAWAAVVALGTLFWKGLVAWYALQFPSAK